MLDELAVEDAGPEAGDEDEDKPFSSRSNTDTNFSRLDRRLKQSTHRFISI